MSVDMCLPKETETVEFKVFEEHAGHTKEAPTNSFEERPSLRDVIRAIGPLPEEALFLGLADDGLPVLLNLWDPAPGPILLAGDSGAGKTRFLQSIARFVALTHDPQEIQYGVITDRLHEWDSLSGDAPCVGIFSPRDYGVAEFIRALALWIRTNRNSRQSVLLLIDGFDGFSGCSSGLIQDLASILLHGPGRRVWPIVSINLERSTIDEHWLEYFHTHVFGAAKSTGTIEENEDRGSRFDDLCKGVEFSLKEKSRWIRFRSLGV